MKKMICLLLSVLCLFTAVALAADSDTITKNGKLIVGITDFAPMDYKDADGKWIGFDADLARLFALLNPLASMWSLSRLTGTTRCLS